MKKIKLKFKNPIKKWKTFSKKKKIITSAIAIVLVAALVSGLVIVRKRNNRMVMPQMTVSEATVTTGSISNTIVGTGNLEIDASDSIKIPSGITIKEVKVESGDSVSKGDILAVVDKTSVLEAMETVQDEIEDLDEEIEDSKDVDETSTVTTKVAGTIKKIYAKEGDSVTECIAENGALIIIAVDGNADETIEVMASSGTISDINVSKNEEVSVGDTLLTIENDEESTEYKKLIAQRKELAESFKTLTSMAKNGTIVADIDGVVGEVNVSEGSTSSSSSSGSGMSASQMSYKTSSTKSVNSKSGVSLVTLSTTSSEASTINEEDTSGNDEKISLSIVNSGSTTKNSLVLEVPKTGAIPQSEIKVTDNSYSGTIKWSEAVSTFAAGTTYGVDITLTAQDGYTFAADSITKVAMGLLSGVSVSNEGKTLSFHVTFPATEEEETQTSSKNVKQQESTTANNNQFAKANSNSNSNNNSNSGSKPTSGTITASASTNTVSSGNSSSSASGTTTTNSDETSYSNQITAFTLASNDTMILSVSVDELDINSVAKDQEATITLDAIEDASFTGTVTKVSNSASSSGNGVAKYTVQITIPKDEQMKSGMNASATIVIENRENVLTIPVNALQEKGNQSFVYTNKDDEGNLSGEVQVTTGLSDGDTVEITEGLSEGDTVYYTKTGKTSGSGSGFEGMFGGGSGEMPEMPDGMGSGGSRDFGGKGSSGGGMPSGMPGGGN